VRIVQLGTANRGRDKTKEIAPDNSWLSVVDASIQIWNWNPKSGCRVQNNRRDHHSIFSCSHYYCIV